jgi:hypothetical protein
MIIASLMKTPGAALSSEDKSEGDVMNVEKRKWEKPALTVLVKGNLEENVLAVCKANQGNCPYKACSALNGRCDGIGVS